MSLEKINKLLEGHEKAEEITTLLTEHVETETKTKSETAATEAKRKANSEAKNVRERFKKKWDALGLDPDSDDFDTHLDELKEKLADAKENKDNKDKGASSEMKALQKRIEKAEKRTADAEAREEASRKKVLKKGAENEVITALTESKAIKPQILLSSLMPNVVIPEDEDGKNIFKQGDDELTIKEGVDKFLEANPEFVANEGTPGGDSGANKGGKGSPEKKPEEVEARRKKLRGMTNQTV